ncbi:hypothetical protein VSO92_04400 [Myroides pelagicus]|nr:hypothetical protein [Myroides pelagicus]MEC4113345.1 hypothetical protein [Myroides pelagicus]
MKSLTLLLIVFFAIQQLSFAQEAVGINTVLPKTTLDVNGKVTIRDTENPTPEDTIKPLYITQDKVVVTFPPTTPTAATSVITASNISIVPNNEENATIFNNASEDIRIPFAEIDITPNNLDLSVDNNYSLVIAETGTYQITGYINLHHSSSLPSRTSNVIGDMVILKPYYANIFVFVKLTLNGTTKVLTGNRPILQSILHSSQFNIITLPTITTKLNAGDKLSLGFRRTTLTSGDGAGSDVNTIGLAKAYGAAPYSITITKL